MGWGQYLFGQPGIGSETPEEYFQFGMSYFKQAKYDSALALLNEARQSYAQHGDLQGQIRCFLQQAGILAELGKKAGAEAHLQQAKNMYNALPEAIPPTEAEILETTADIYYHKQQFAQAIENFDKALEIKIKVLGEIHADIADIYRKKSLTVFAVNNMPEAFRLAALNKEVLEQLPSVDTTLWADYYLALGSFYDRTGKHEEAQQYYGQSLRVNLQERGELHPQTARSYLNLSNILRIRGNPFQARDYAEKSLHIFGQVYGQDHIVMGAVNNSLAILDADLGDQAKAIVYYENALHIFTEKMGAESMQAAFILNNLGVVYSNSGQPEKALEVLTESLKVRKKYVPENSIPMGVVYLNMADAYKEAGRLEEALAYNQKAAKIFDEAGYAIGSAPAYRGMAEVYFAQKNFREALGYFRKSARIYEGFSGENYVDLGETYNLIANTFNTRNQPDSALVYYQEALKVLVPGFTPDDTHTHPVSFEYVNSWQHAITAMAGKAQTFFQIYEGDTVTNTHYLQQAFDTYNVVAGLIDKARGAYRQDASRLYLSGIVKPVYQQAIEVAYHLYQLQPENSYLERAFTFSEKSKYALLSDFMRRSVVKTSAGLPDSVLQQEETVNNEVALLEQALLDANQKQNKDTIPVLEAALTNAKKKHLDFLARLEEEYPDYFALIYDTRVASVNDVQQNLVDDEVLLEYALTNDAIFLFVITPGTTGFLRFPKDIHLENKILSLRSAIQQKDFQEYTQTAYDLYRQCVQQAEGKLESFQKLKVVPDGMLALLPLEILITDAPSSSSEDYSNLSYLLEKYQISYNYSATVALAAQQKQATEASIEVLGFAPDFSGYQNPGFIAASSVHKDTIRGALLPLEGADIELKNLSALFHGKFLFKNEATEENFKRLATQSRIIHLATHAVADDADPLYSRLYFTQTDTSKEDGVLHTYELYNLQLNAALVTLSACNTGLGKIQRGEGIVSLASGFAYAGCPNIVMSLWPASDKATARLMEDFYQGLAQGLPKDKALHEAKLKYLASADPLSANPYLWGSFVFVGDASPLKTEGIPVRGVVAIMAGIILLISGIVYFIRNRRKG